MLNEFFIISGSTLSFYYFDNKVLLSFKVFLRIFLLKYGVKKLNNFKLTVCYFLYRIHTSVYFKIIYTHINCI